MQCVHLMDEMVYFMKDKYVIRRISNVGNIEYGKMFNYNSGVQ